MNCDDGDGCTEDTCDVGAGCVHTPIGCGDLAIVSPNGGGSLPTGETVTIRWTAPAAAAKFDLQYTIDNGSTWKSIVKGVTGRSYEWTVPYLTANKAKSKVKLIARNAAGAKTGTDVSDAPFAITVIVLKGPNGGESYGSGEHASIAWITNGTARTVASVKLLYTLDGGSTWKTIATLSSNPGAYDWTVPTVTKTKSNCKVRVMLKDSSGNSLGKDDSNATFTLHP